MYLNSNASVMCISFLQILSFGYLFLIHNGVGGIEQENSRTHTKKNKIKKALVFSSCFVSSFYGIIFPLINCCLIDMLSLLRL